MASEAPSMNFKSGQRRRIQVSKASAAAMKFSVLETWLWHSACFQHGIGSCWIGYLLRNHYQSYLSSKSWSHYCVVFLYVCFGIIFSITLGSTLICYVQHLKTSQALLCRAVTSKWWLEQQQRGAQKRLTQSKAN